MSHDSCPVLNLFLDWNPIYTDDYTGGYDGRLYQPADDEPSLWGNLVEKAKKVQVMFLRHSGLVDHDLKAICGLMKPDAGPTQNKSLKVLDISYNNFTADLLCKEVSSVFENNRMLEYLGVAKCGLGSQHMAEMLEHFGRVPFPAD